MKVVCEACSAVYQIEEAALTREVSRATCRRCGHRILIHRPATGLPVGTRPVPLDEASRGAPQRGPSPVVRPPPSGPTPTVRHPRPPAVRPAPPAARVRPLARRTALIVLTCGIALVLAVALVAFLAGPATRSDDRTTPPAQLPGTVLGGPASGVPASVIDIQLRNDGNLKACVLEHQASTGQLPRVTLAFTLDARGSVTTASLEETEYQGSAFESCLVGSLERIGFPALGGEPITVRFPFRF